jgi:hypothetical protein
MRKLYALLIICFSIIFSSTVRGQANTGVNDAELKGDYAFTMA